MRSERCERPGRRIAALVFLVAVWVASGCEERAAAPFDAGPDTESETEPFAGCGSAAPVWWGDAVITGPESLAALVGYRRISGSLVIDGTALAGLAGLESLRCVDGDVYVVTNQELLGLGGLANLREVGGLYVEGCPALVDLHGLGDLETIGGELSIAACAALENLDGLDSLRAVERISIRENPALADLGALAGLAAIPGRMVIHDNDSLATLAGLEAVQGATAQLEVSENDALLSLAALGGLGSCGELRVTRCPLLADLTGLDGIAEVSGELWIDGDDGLASLEGLGSLVAVGRLVVGLRGLLVGKGSPYYDGWGNAGLVDLSGLDSLVAVGELEVVQNPSLESLHGLEGIVEIPEDVWIDANPSLSSLAGLESLAAVGGELVLGQQPIIEVAEPYWIGVGNAGLADLGAVAALSHVGGWLSIRGNAALPTCAATALCDQLDAAPTAGCCVAANLVDGCADEAAGCPVP